MKRFLFIFIWIPLVAYNQQVYKTENFSISFNPADVPANNSAAYTSPRTNHSDPKVPHYIQDMGYYLQTAYDTYVQMGLASKIDIRVQGAAYPATANIKLDTVKVNIPIIVEELKDASGTQIDGETSPTQLSINKLVPPDHGMTSAVCLQKTCSHELLHFVMLKHYSAAAAGLTNFKNYWRRLDFGTKWWWEVLAVQGDRLVWPANTSYEAEYYAQDATVNLSAILHRSWDDANEDPNWYAAGGFITYLLHYRTGMKANFHEIFLRPSRNITSLTRTVLDEYLRNDLFSLGLGWEYHNYVKWNYEGSGFAKIDNDILAVKGNDHTKRIKLNDKTKNTDTVAVSIPYMSAKIFRIRNEDDRPKTILIKNLSESANLQLYAYEVVPQGKKTFLKRLLPYSSNDSLIVKLEGRAKWIDVLSLPTTIDGSEEAKLAVVELVSAEGDYKGAVDFADDNNAMKKRYTIKVSNLQLKVDATNKVTGSLDFYMDYVNDGQIAKTSDFVGTVSIDGRVQVAGKVAETIFPKCDKDCCTYEKILQGTPCFKVSKEIYWVLNGKLKAIPATGKKELAGFIVVARTPIPKNDKAVLKYKVSTQ